jgi:hypothetical protein
VDALNLVALSPVLKRLPWFSLSHPVLAIVVRYAATGRLIMTPGRIIIIILPANVRTTGLYFALVIVSLGTKGKPYTNDNYKD